MLLVEKEPILGGQSDSRPYAALTPHMEDAEQAMKRMVDADHRRPLVEVRKETTVVAAEGDAPEIGHPRRPGGPSR